VREMLADQVAAGKHPGVFLPQETRQVHGL
jgi:hypothetical protein